MPKFLLYLGPVFRGRVSYANSLNRMFDFVYPRIMLMRRAANIRCDMLAGSLMCFEVQYV
jgi:hypothetical protein